MRETRLSRRRAVYIVPREILQCADVRFPLPGIIPARLRYFIPRLLRALAKRRLSRDSPRRRSAANYHGRSGFNVIRETISAVIKVILPVCTSPARRSALGRWLEERRSSRIKGMPGHATIVILIADPSSEFAVDLRGGENFVGGTSRLHRI